MAQLNKVGHEFAQSWIKTMRNKEYDALKSFFSSESVVAFNSPVVHTTYKGLDRIKLILTNVIEVFQEFEYVNEGYVTAGAIPNSTQNSDAPGPHVGVVLMFKAFVEDPESGKRLQIEGVDIFEVNNQGKATHLKVMVRPLNSAIALAKHMNSRMTGKL